MDDLGLGNVCGLLFALLDTKEDQCDADAAAKAKVDADAKAKLDADAATAAKVKDD